MLKNSSYFIIFLQTILVIIWYMTLKSLPVVIGEVVFILLITLNKLGKGIVLREIIAFHVSIIVLLMPQIGYIYYNKGNALANLWVKNMPITDVEYFSFIIPAVLLFNLTLLWPILSKNKEDEGVLFLKKFESIKLKLRTSNLNPQNLIITGTIFYSIIKYFPVSFQYVGFLAFLVSFVGFLMIYFTPKAKNRNISISFFIIFLSYVTLSGGMFTIVVYMGMTIFSFLFLGRSIALFWKLLIFSLILFSLITIQNIKEVLRSSINSRDSSALVFGTLVSNEVKKGEDYFSIDKFFYVYVRANQGFYIAGVMKHIPAYQNYDDGEYLFKAFLSAFIPRLFWPDKPTAGGRFTTKYFTGNNLVGNTSMNVSPIGEAYGSFGPRGAIVYLFFLALFIRWVYIKIFALTNKLPFIIFWIPVIFFQVTYSMETDSLQIFNSVIKSTIFVTVIYYVSPILFGITRRQQKINLTSI